MLVGPLTGDCVVVKLVKLKQERFRYPASSIGDFSGLLEKVYAQIIADSSWVIEKLNIDLPSVAESIRHFLFELKLSSANKQ